MERVKLYTKNYCPFCHGALGLLEDLGVEYENVDVTNDDSLIRPLQEKENYFKVPMIYVNGKFIGGYSEFKEIVESGEFEEMID